MSAAGITVAIMAGGKSSRMGTDKSFVPLLGKPLIEHVMERVYRLGEETILITNKPGDYAHLGLPMFGDIYPDRGPLGGFHTALSHARFPHVLVVACDMPWLNRPLLEYMISLRETADIVVPQWDKYPEPLHAVYGRACLEPIEENLRAGLLKLTAFFGKVRVHFLDRPTIARFDPAGRSFANLNTPEELAQAGEGM
ncbi:MAG: molybdenum cofactor guanylyltransferase [Chloroflexi bacterium]|nr:molybdenum cofactor guanylyltransferase [Chloroflexota bacterium]MCI0575218.1 molybdenum cofactor guanylyltransferase [Chloroflexota bacterium]MCI0643822.1 molybdenum cofactor guanylyltransferase [Chloroflexota bacterium]MCI0726080.1 molybdenum cofactor guanylyltransferase [Chloroflexota bacterium]